jgi:hypothetical protein
MPMGIPMLDINLLSAGSRMLLLLIELVLLEEEHGT